MYKLILASIIMFFASFHISKANSADSLRLETSDGVNFVIHKVTPGQTLYSMLRKYGSNLADFKKHNPDVALEIQVDQLLRIPYFKPINGKKVAKTKVVATKQTESTNDEQYITKKVPAKTFKVEPGMTLFAVAKRNGISVAEVKRLNNLKSDVIQVGQTLIVKEAETIQVAIVNTVEPEIVAKRPEKKVIEQPKEVPVKNDVIVVETRKPIETPKIEQPKPVEPKPKVEQPKPVEKSTEIVKVAIPKIEQPPIEVVKTAEEIENTADRKVKIEEGIAEIIEVESKSGKYLALHKSAPLGTLVQVRNETNGASVWVKVIGRLPEVDQNQNVIIKLSPKAMARISPVDKRFRAKINYSM
jgi:LysM repeat protein